MLPFAAAYGFALAVIGVRLAKLAMDPGPWALVPDALKTAGCHPTALSQGCRIT
jgi:hypothetical protein